MQQMHPSFAKRPQEHTPHRRQRWWGGEQHPKVRLGQASSQAAPQPCTVVRWSSLSTRTLLSIGKAKGTGFQEWCEPKQNLPLEQLPNLLRWCCCPFCVLLPWCPWGDKTARNRVTLLFRYTYVHVNIKKQNQLWSLKEEELQVHVFSPCCQHQWHPHHTRARKAKCKRDGPWWHQSILKPPPMLAPWSFPPGLQTCKQLHKYSHA